MSTATVDEDEDIEDRYHFDAVPIASGDDDDAATGGAVSSSSQAATPDDHLIVGVVRRGVQAFGGNERRSSRRRRYGSSSAEVPKAPPGTAAWEVSRSVEDLIKPGGQFYAAATLQECAAALERQFPAPHPALTRVEPVGQAEHYDGQLNRHVRGPVRRWYVHVRPLALTTQEPARFGFPSGTDWVTALEQLAQQHGSILIRAEKEALITTRSGYFQSNLVVSDSGSPHYRLLRHDPGKSQARRTREDNDRKRNERERLEKQQQREKAERCRPIRRALDALAAAICMDLFTSLPELHLREILGGSVWTDLDSVREQLLPLYERLRGRRAYRRLPEWWAARDAYRQRPQDAGPEDLGLEETGLLAWWEQEMTARAPRRLNQPTAAAQPGTDLGDPDPSAADEAEEQDEG